MRILILSLFLVFLVGCSFLEKFAPSQLDEQGKPIAGTHQLTPFATSTSQAIPYGEVATGVLLLVWNFVERVRANKNEKGLKATVLAIKQAGQDPATADAIAQLKIKLSQAHELANVKPLINYIISKV